MEAIAVACVQAFFGALALVVGALVIRIADDAIKSFAHYDPWCDILWLRLLADIGVAAAVLYLCWLVGGVVLPLILWTPEG